MTLNLEITVEDLAEWHEYYQRHSRFTRRTYLLSFVWGPIIGVILAAVARLSDFRTILATVVVTTILLSLYRTLMFPVRLRNIIKAVLNEGSHRAAAGPKTLSLGPDAIKEVGDYSQTAYKWTALEKVERNGNYLYLLMRGGGCFIVPKRCFSDVSQEADFMRRIEQGRASGSA